MSAGVVSDLTACGRMAAATVMASLLSGDWTFAVGVVSDLTARGRMAAAIFTASLLSSD